MSPKANDSFNKLAILAFCVFYVISVSLLLIASLFTASALPAWGGPVDVVIAFVIVLFAFWFYVKTGQADLNKEIQISYHVASLLPAFVLVMLWLWRERLNFNIILPGLEDLYFVPNNTQSSALME